MKRKRLTREGWGFQGFPYYQMHVDLPEFRGLACVIRILSGDECTWSMPRAGRVPVAGAGMLWLQLIPDGQHRVLTVKYRPKALWEPLPRVSVWYADVIDRIEYDPDGVAAFVDQYLDVIFSPQGDVHTDDREELDAALQSGELTAAQHARAIAEGEDICRCLCTDVRRTEKWCGEILRHVLSRLDGPDVLRRNARGAEMNVWRTNVMNMRTIYLAGGCYWGVEKYVANIAGVMQTEVGFANGHIDSPAYVQVKKGDTGHAETVRVVYDADVLPLEKLLRLFFRIIDPTSFEKQGEDVGNQYRTGVYWVDAADETVVLTELAVLQERYEEPLVVEALPLDCFYPAEEYHQKYLDKNPGGYCHVPWEEIDWVKTADLGAV